MSVTSPVVAKLEVTFHANGDVNVSGCTENKALCYSMLEIAKDLVRAHHQSKQETRVALPESGDVARFGTKSN